MEHLNGLIQKEHERQVNQVNLIASENYTPQHILNVLSSKLSNKYAEGFGKNRYYAGIQVVNEIEEFTIDQAKRVFNAHDFDVNVQALSGSPANLAILCGLLEPGDTILSLALQKGGHLSHGATTSIISKIFNVKHYGLTKDEKEEIDFDQMERILKKQSTTAKPVKMLIAGYSGYCRDIDYKRLKQLCERYNVHLHVDFSHTAGLVAAKLLNDPFLHADSLMCTTHKTLRGPRGALIFSKNGDKINKGVFPGLQGGPHMNNVAGIGATLACVDDDYFGYQRKTIENRQTLMKFFNKQVLFQQGSDNHMFIIKNIKDGSVVEKALEEQSIIINKQVMGPNAQGIRIGTPFVTSQQISAKRLKKAGQQILETIRCIEGDDWGRV